MMKWLFGGRVSWPKNFHTGYIH